MEDNIYWWTVKRKAALVTEIIQGKTMVAEASRSFDMPASRIEEWVDEAKKSRKRTLRRWSTWDQRSVERLTRTFKEHCAHLYRFERVQYASRLIDYWIGPCYRRRPHQARYKKSSFEA